MHYEYTKLLRATLALILLALLLASSAPVARAQNQAEEERQGIIATLKDRDFGLVLSRYKKRLILILLSPLFICCSCCAVICFLPCVCVVVCGCGALSDEAGVRKRGRRDLNRNAVVVTETFTERQVGIESAPPLEAIAAQYVSTQYSADKTGNMYPPLTITHGTIDTGRKLESTRNGTRRNSYPAEEIYESNIRYNFLSLDDLDKIERRAKEYTLKRVEIGESKV